MQVFVRHPWELVTNGSPWALPQTSWIRNSGGRARPSVLTSPAGDSDVGSTGEPLVKGTIRYGLSWTPDQKGVGGEKANQLACKTCTMLSPGFKNRFMERTWFWKNENPMAFCFRRQENWKKTWSLKVWVYSPGFYTPTNQCFYCSYIQEPNTM